MDDITGIGVAGDFLIGPRPRHRLKGEKMKNYHIFTIVV